MHVPSNGHKNIFSSNSQDHDSRDDKSNPKGRNFLRRDIRPHFNLFSVFSNITAILQQIDAEMIHPFSGTGIRTQHLGHECPVIVTRPVLPP